MRVLSFLLFVTVGPHHIFVSAFNPMVQKRPVSILLTTEQKQPKQQSSILFGSATDDCGCSPASTIIFSGKPSMEARRSNPRQAIKEATSSLYDVNGESVVLEDLLTKGNRDVSIVVFLRSLG
jgi:hypothetical protein